MPHAGPARDDAAMDAATLSGVPLDDVAAAQNFEPRLSDWLALLQRHGNGHFLYAVAELDMDTLYVEIYNRCV
jgi:hypothetical protein